MPEFTSFFKYCSDNLKVIEGIFKDQKIRFTQPWALNDPLEFNPTIKFRDQASTHQSYELDGIVFPSIESFYRVQIIESQINAYGILSLTNTPFSFDMWGKYANGHKGFVLELKPDFARHVCMKSKDGCQNTIRKVEYVDDYVLTIENLVNVSGIISLETLQNEFFFKKTSRWKDEQEYRLIRPLSDLDSYKPPQVNLSYRDEKIYLFDFHLDCISSVIFGVHMSIESKKSIMEYCEGHEIQFFQSYVIRDEKDDFGKPGRVAIISVNNLETPDELYKFKPQLLPIDKDCINNTGKPLRIFALADLPYYEGYEEIIQDFLSKSRNAAKLKETKENSHDKN